MSITTTNSRGYVIVSPTAKSFVESANNSETDFPIQNLPYGVFSLEGGAVHTGVRIGEKVFSLTAAADAGLFTEVEGLNGGSYFKEETLNKFMGAGRVAWAPARQTVAALLSAETTLTEEQKGTLLFDASAVTMRLPSQIGDYTDFYASRQHATNIGTLFRGAANALQPNWLRLPVGYHGRSSSIVPSGTEVVRPCGQTKAPDAADSAFNASKVLDFELEVGFFVGKGNKMGTSIDLADAEKEHIFGICLLNDWSARDIQKWEYVPLGPFTAKNWASTISTWIVPIDAVDPFRIAGEEQTNVPLPYLQQKGGRTFNVALEVHIQTPESGKPMLLGTSNMGTNLYWSIAQQLTHHTVTGCPMSPGDMCGTGTISGTDPTTFGSLIEMTEGGKKTITLPNGEERKFIQDGDIISLKGMCNSEHGFKIGFGECTGKVLPAANNAVAQKYL